MVASFISLESGNGDLFQRLGSVAVAISIGYFGYMASLSATIAPRGYHQTNNVQLKTNILHGEGIAQANRSVSILAAAIVARNREQNIVTRPTIMAIAAPAMEDLPQMKDRPSQDAETLDLMTEEQVSIDSYIESQNRIRETTQIVFAVVGTLQWGFGDCIATWGVACR